jgi:PGF-pre-PGF domain-containing protein
LKKGVNFILFFIVFSLALFISSSIVYADCGGLIPCSCGDTLNESRTLNASDTLTGCSDNGLIINSSDIALDCAGYTISGSGVSVGVNVSNSDNVVVNNCIIHSFGDGIDVNLSDNVNLTDNTIYNISSSGNGIGVQTSYSIRIDNNNITGVYYGIFSSYATLHIEDSEINGGSYGIYFGFATGTSTIIRNNINGTSQAGIQTLALGASHNISENNITGNYRGLVVGDSYPIIYHNNIYNNSNLSVYGYSVINLSYNNEGNYWGHGSCPVFIPMFDSNAFYVGDRYAYKTLNGWLSESPVDCPPMWANPLNYTPLNYSSSPSQFNISWGDELGVDTVLITIMNSTGYILVNNSSMGTTYGYDMYNYSIVLPPGTFNWTSYANDSAGNWSSSDMWTFTIGKGVLSLSITANQNVTYPTSTTVMGIETNDGDSDLTYQLWRGSTLVTQTYPYSETALLVFGTHVYIFNATGGANWTANTAGVNSTVVVSSAPGTIPSDVLYSIKVYRAKGLANITISKIMTDKTANVTISKTEDLAIRKISISVLNTVNDIEITITKLPQKPAEVVHEISGKIYHYIEITKENIGDTDINKTFIQFAVDKSWLDEYSINYSNISLYRWANNKWNELSTSLDREGTLEVFYEAKSPGFSIFAIGTKEGVTPCTESWSCTDWSDCVDGKQIRTCTDSNVCGTIVNRPEESRDCVIEELFDIEEKLGIGKTEIVIVSIILIVVIATVLVFLYKKKTISFDFLKKKGKRKYKYKPPPE